MASLRLLHCPQSPHFSTEQQFSQKSPLSSLYKPPNTNSANNTILSWSISTCSRIQTQILPIRRRRISYLVSHVSSTVQDTVLDDVSTQPQLDTKQEEEFSNTRLLASNVPWTCTAEDIRSLFGKFGTVLDVEFSMYSKTNNRGLAFVSMGSPEEAAAALSNLDSYEFEGRPLRVNYAKLKKKKRLPSVPRPVPTFNLFVANLSYEARSQHLREFFKAEGRNVVSAEVIFHENPRRSSGYGFVAFKTKKEADEALAAFEGKIFMGRPIRVKRSRQFVKAQAKEHSPSDDTPNELTSGTEQKDTTDKS
ncbi:31 kDa ribonucleoprotein chloroplastic-like [Tripterygium wilfordii]|uniref:31 kDa ribonucleoprotein chloroplastic-like n=1 Tax=Tripterygium wilfordii TaxID=458696 RepID=A0A7J7D1S6_TRIWF|nr:28 kDa ribonucleoprotein, chloroplastic [Tripterygium wilfordii]XP_038715286.1 28 kDa ribonucleoprotein, chloroplastic [Tripterygium wilfordii]KAF5740189.1 31 kDa ribonucleoprotein chloroplastic-like [Tripterygium wilfordii]